MQASKLKKDKMTSIRYNSEVLLILKNMGYRSIQHFIDVNIDQEVNVELTKPVPIK